MRILFLCVENSARSQMAEGIAKKLFGDTATIESAGANPSRVHPLAIEVMREIDIDISKQRSKSVNAINSDDIDFIITLCSEEVCPFVSGNFKKLHWPFPNPTSTKSEAKPIENFRTIRDELFKKISEFKSNLDDWTG